VPEVRQVTIGSDPPKNKKKKHERGEQKVEDGRTKNLGTTRNKMKKTLNYCGSLEKRNRRDRSLQLVRKSHDVRGKLGEGTRGRIVAN